VRSSIPGENFHLRRQRGDLDVDFLVVELAFAQHLAEFLPRGRVGRLHVVEVHFARGRQQHVEHAFFGRIDGTIPHLSRFRFTGLLDRCFCEIADDGIDVPTDIAYFGELGCLDFDERCIGEPRQPPRDLRLADASRSDHEDILRRDFLPQRLGDLLASPAIAHGDGHRALGRVLPDDMLVELVNDFRRSHG